MKSGDGDGWQLTWRMLDSMAESTVRQDATTFNVAMAPVGKLASDR